MKALRFEILRAVRRLNSLREKATAVNIARQVDCHRNTIDNHLPYLTSQGLLITTIGKGSKPNTYRVTLQAVELLEEALVTHV